MSPHEQFSATRLLRLHIWVVATLIPVLDRLLTLPQMLCLLTPRWPGCRYQGLTAEVISGFVERRLRHPRQMRRRACLRRSLVLYHFLRLAGLDATFHVAVFPPSVDPQRLHAHSWVTVGPQWVSEPPGAGAMEMFRYGAPEEAGPDGHATRALG